MKYYLAYGSNLSVEQMSVRCPDAIYVGKAYIKNHRLALRGHGGPAYFTIEPFEGSVVEALVWKVNKEHEKALDRYEGYPNFYIKENMKVEVRNLMDNSPIKEVTAFVYVMRDFFLLGIPTDTYFTICTNSAERFGIPVGGMREAYIRSLQAQNALDEGTEGCEAI